MLEQKWQNNVYPIPAVNSAANFFSWISSDRCKDFTWHKACFPSGINQQRHREVRWGRSFLKALSWTDESLFLSLSHGFLKHWQGIIRPLSLSPPAVAGHLPHSLWILMDNMLKKYQESLNATDFAMKPWSYHSSINISNRVKVCFAIPTLEFFICLFSLTFTWTDNNLYILYHKW